MVGREEGIEVAVISLAEREREEWATALWC